MFISLLSPSFFSSSSRVVLFSHFGRYGFSFCLEASNRLVDPALPFFYWKVDWGSGSSAGAFFCPTGFYAFTSSMGHFEMRVSFFMTRFLLILRFFFPRIFKRLLFPLEGFFSSLLMSSWTSFCPLGGILSPGF